MPCGHGGGFEFIGIRCSLAASRGWAQTIDQCKFREVTDRTWKYTCVRLFCKRKCKSKGNTDNVNVHAHVNVNVNENVNVNVNVIVIVNVNLNVSANENANVIE